MRTTREEDNKFYRVKTWSLNPDGTESYGLWHGPFFRRADAARAVSAEEKSIRRWSQGDRDYARRNNLPIPAPRVLKTRFQTGTVEWIDEAE